MLIRVSEQAGNPLYISELSITCREEFNNYVRPPFSMYLFVYAPYQLRKGPHIVSVDHRILINAKLTRDLIGDCAIEH